MSEIYQIITRNQVETTWAMWVEVGKGTHAVLLDASDGSKHWVETDSANAHEFGRHNGFERTARIASEHVTAAAIWLTEAIQGSVNSALNQVHHADPNITWEHMINEDLRAAIIDDIVQITRYDLGWN